MGIATAAPDASSKLHVAGAARIDGMLTAGTFVARYQDLAEWVPAARPLAAGTVVVLDPERSNHVQPSRHAYDATVAGAISAAPGILLGEGGDDRVKVATTGRVKGRIERAIQYIRTSFAAARPFTTLEDFNGQARQWRNQIAHQRRWPQDDSRIVQDVFEEEQPRLLPLPAHPFDSDLVISVRSGKTIYVRFDRNDYSIPPDAVGQELTLTASPLTVRILKGATEIARHRRCWDRHQIIEDPEHRQALLAEKRRALGSSPSGRLRLAVPESETLLDEAFRRGESIGRSTTQLIQLLDAYGAEALRWAIGLALQRQTPRVSSVAWLLEQRHRCQRLATLHPVTLDRRPDLADLHVQPHDSDIYDELSQHDDE